jgi:hypothetical protein
VVHENTPLSRMIPEFGMQFLESDKIITNHYWVADVNPGFDFPERVKRQLELYEHAAKYHWPIWRFRARVEELKFTLENFYKLRSEKPVYRTIKLAVNS